MSALVRAAKRIIPRSVKAAVRERLRPIEFAVCVNRFKRLADGPVPVDLLDRLVWGWANDWSATSEYLAGLLGQIGQTTGPVLECGSGLTTLLAGIRCQHLGRRMWSLEHNPLWADRVEAMLARYGVRSVTVCRTQLVDYGAYGWYQPTGLGDVGDFSLVVCDGPPGDTKGGRYGLLPVLGDRLAPGCRVLLDDAARPAEQAALAKWADDYGVTWEVRGCIKPYAVASVNPRVTPPAR